MFQEKGLSRDQVLEKRRKNLVNTYIKSYTRSYLRIFLDNIFSYFNIIMTAFFVLLVITKNYTNTLFMGVVISNLFMGILQEIKMKRIVDGLSVIKQSTVKVLRDAKWQEILDCEIVEGDVISLKSGDSVTVDGKILKSDGVELDEAMISGEAEPVLKTEGDTVFSGSCVLSGATVIKVTNVGSGSFAGKITAQAKSSRKVYSPLTKAIEKIIKIMSVIILPITVLLFWSQYFFKNSDFGTAVVSTAGASIGMIPGGLVLLTTVTMALGVLRCAKKGAFISQQKAVETLARIDTLCIDKTGTITTGNIRLADIVNMDKPDGEKANSILYSLISSFEEKNATAQAILKYFKDNNFKETLYAATKKIPFSSKRKYCAALFENEGFFALGAPEFLATDTPVYTKLKESGGRIVALVKYSQESVNKENGEVIAYIKFEDEIRADAKEIIDSLKKSGVEIKIISGDSTEAIKAVATKVGFLKSAKAVDMSKLKDLSDSEVKKAVFGAEIFARCEPQQKRQLIRIFQERGRVVAMTGDGVNDVPAMRRAQCAVAMSTGADAAKGVADVVLKNSFAPMSQVILEGRRVINNMSRVAVLYLVKTVFSLLLAVYFVFSSVNYPLKPIHLTLIGSVFTGIPSFFMALEKNYRSIKKGFTAGVIMEAVPGAIGIAVSVIILSILKQNGIISASDFLSLCVWITGVVSGMVLLISASPLNFYRSVLVFLMAVIYIAAMLVLKPLIEISHLSPYGIFLLWTVILLNAALIFVLDIIKKKIILKK